MFFQELLSGIGNSIKMAALGCNQIGICKKEKNTKKNIDDLKKVNNTLKNK